METIKMVVGIVMAVSCAAYLAFAIGFLGTAAVNKKVRGIALAMLKYRIMLYKEVSAGHTALMMAALVIGFGLSMMLINWSMSGPLATIAIVSCMVNYFIAPTVVYMGSVFTKTTA